YSSSHKVKFVSVVVGTAGRSLRAWAKDMTVQIDEHDRSMAFAEIAIGQIKALRQPAYPRNYEVWYSYATGYNPQLNQTINETLQRTGTLTGSDIEQIYDTYLNPTRLTDRIDTVGSQVVDEIEQ